MASSCTRAHASFFLWSATCTRGQAPSGQGWRCRTSDDAACPLIERHTSSDQISDVHRHLFDLRVVELLNILHRAHIRIRHEIDRDTLPAESAAAPNAMQVVLHVLWKVVIDDQGYLLHVDPTCQQVGRDEHPGRTRAELSHDEVSLFLV